MSVVLGLVCMNNIFLNCNVKIIKGDVKSDLICKIYYFYFINIEYYEDRSIYIYVIFIEIMNDN